MTLRAVGVEGVVGAAVFKSGAWFIPGADDANASFRFLISGISLGYKFGCTM
jgi:hypothetical protein